MLVSAIKTVKSALDGLASPGARLGFSQFGEDLMLLPILETYKQIDNGFYVDVGAFHPFTYSNTALLHLYRGWKGVNIDASVEAIALFNQFRPSDHNVHAAVSDEEAELDYALFNHGGVNSLDARMIENQVSRPGSPFKIVDRVRMRTRRLDQILDELPSVPKEFGLLSVDCEGLDHKVLNSLDWQRYRPHLVAVETHGMDLNDPSKSPTHGLMLDNGYRLISHAFVTSIYIRK